MKTVFLPAALPLLPADVGGELMAAVVVSGCAEEGITMWRPETKGEAEVDGTGVGGPCWETGEERDSRGELAAAFRKAGALAGLFRLLEMVAGGDRGILRVRSCGGGWIGGRGVCVVFNDEEVKMLDGESTMDSCVVMGADEMEAGASMEKGLDVDVDVSMSQGPSAHPPCV